MEPSGKKTRLDDTPLWVQSTVEPLVKEGGRGEGGGEEEKLALMRRQTVQYFEGGRGWRGGGIGRWADA